MDPSFKAYGPILSIKAYGPSFKVYGPIFTCIRAYIDPSCKAYGLIFSYIIRRILTNLLRPKDPD